MPLANILSGKTRRCRARCKARGDQCWNPAAHAQPVCRVHGARKPGTIRRGRAHPAYKHGQETLQAKRERSAKLKELRDIEGAMTVLGVLDGPRWRGRKPRRAK